MILSSKDTLCTHNNKNIDVGVIHSPKGIAKKIIF